MNYRIRSYQPGDFTQVGQLWSQTDMGGSERGDDERIILQTLEMEGRFIIMDHPETGEIIGTSWITNDGRRLYLHHFCINPKWQGRGFSHPLMEASLDFVKEKGMQVKLEVKRNNTIAKELYQRYGFGLLGDYQVYIIRDINA